MSSASAHKPWSGQRQGRGIHALSGDAIREIRNRRYKYVHFTALPPLFYDLERDPGEFENRADDPEHRGLVLDYAQKMLSWRMNHEERVLANHAVTPEGVKVRHGPRW